MPHLSPTSQGTDRWLRQADPSICQGLEEMVTTSYWTQIRARAGLLHTPHSGPCLCYCGNTIMLPVTCSVAQTLVGRASSFLFAGQQMPVVFFLHSKEILG